MGNQHSNRHVGTLLLEQSRSARPTFPKRAKSRKPVTRRTQAMRAIDFINGLKHTKGKHALEYFRLRPWQIKILRKLFTVQPDGLRKYRTCLMMLPRKNGKTELAAALAIYFLIADNELGAEVYSAAADREQA